MLICYSHVSNWKALWWQSNKQWRRIWELFLGDPSKSLPLSVRSGAVISMPKTLVPSPSDKPKSKIGLQPLRLVNHSQRGGSAKSDVAKKSNVGKLHVLKPPRERNGISLAAKDSLSPTMGSRVANRTEHHSWSDYLLSVQLLS